MTRFLSRKETGALLFTFPNPLPLLVAPSPALLAPPFLFVPFTSKPLFARFSNTSILQTPFFRPLSSSSFAAIMPGTGTAGVEWSAKRVRDTFIKFFEEKNHVNWKSSPVVPLNDPTLLFANAGLILFFIDY